MTKIKSTLLCFLLFFLSQCGKEKTEQEKYEAMTSSLKYGTYKTVSKTTVPPSIQAYNSGKPKDSIIDEISLRLLLGYNWAVIAKPEFAFAEADIITEKTKVVQELFLARSLRSIVMYEQGWDTLASKESNAAMSMDTSQSKETIRTQMMVYHLIMATLFMKEKKFDNASFHFAAFGQITGIKWPYLLCDATADIEKGNYQTGLQKLKKMSKDPSVPEELRIIITEKITEIEKQTGGDVDSSLFWPKTIYSILLNDVKKSAGKEWQQMMEYVETVSGKISQ